MQYLNRGKFYGKPTVTCYLASKFCTMYRLLTVLFFLGLTAGCVTTSPVSTDRSYARLVNPFIGTGGHGHTYPGATLPFGMVQVSPDTRLEGWDGCSAYHYTDSLIYGFSHTHLQGTGVSDYGDILIMPTNNSVHTGNNWGERYRSAFDKSTEKAHAGYYSVHLDDHNITAELTATTRVGIHKYTFDQPDSCVVFMDMEHRDELVTYNFDPIGDSIIVGYRKSKAWAEDQLVYFAAHYSAPFEYLDQTFELYTEMLPDGTKQEVAEYVPVFPLKFGVIDTLVVKVALSSSSIEGALANLAAEAPHWDFARYRADAEAAWNKALGAIDIKTSDRNDEVIFYSALYHTLTVPNTWSDVDGGYRGTDLENHILDSSQSAQYTVFSLWDTFRATHPLYTIIERERTADFIQSMLNMYQQGGRLPMWELAANYTGCMIGYHSVPVIVDAYMKGITDFDHQLALEAMIATATADELGKISYAEQGYLASEVEHESVSKTLEYAYNDWCIARFAEAIGADRAIVDEFDERSLAYRNLFHPESKFIQPRRGGSFIEGFHPEEVNFNYTEANGWQYNFFAPHDVNGHIALIGGDEAYTDLLNEMFTSTTGLKGRDQADITGLIGQYAHGNEPSHHMAYLYAFTGNAHLAQARSHELLKTMYSNAPDGLSGNEDCGQMSAWYVLSALGFYPVTPGSVDYVFGSPLFDSATLNLENGKVMTIRAKREKPEDIYIQSVVLNGAPFTRSCIRHEELMAGGELEFTLGNQPNLTFGSALADRPQARVNDDRFVPTAIIDSPRSFEGTQVVRLLCADMEAEMFVRSITLFGDTGSFEPYTAPITLSESTILEAYSERNGRRSAMVRSEITKLDPSRRVVITPEFDNQYSAGGSQALIDGIKGGPNFKTGEWQGYFGTDVVITVDLSEAKPLSSVALGSLQDIRPWIWCPPSVEFTYSLDNEKYYPLATIVCPIDVRDETPLVYRFKHEQAFTTRYVRAEVKNYGTIPDWHLGVGNKSWLFLDEFEIEVAK